jgi:hypothetical protein
MNADNAESGKKEPQPRIPKAVPPEACGARGTISGMKWTRRRPAAGGLRRQGSPHVDVAAEGIA